jgi:hypothetical protein
MTEEFSTPAIRYAPCKSLPDRPVGGWTLHTPFLWRSSVGIAVGDAEDQPDRNRRPIADPRLRVFHDHMHHHGAPLSGDWSGLLGRNLCGGLAPDRFTLRTFRLRSYGRAQKAMAGSVLRWHDRRNGTELVLVSHEGVDIGARCWMLRRAGGSTREIGVPLAGEPLVITV